MLEILRRREGIINPETIDQTTSSNVYGIIAADFLGEHEINKDTVARTLATKLQELQPELYEGLKNKFKLLKTHNTQNKKPSGEAWMQEIFAGATNTETIKLLRRLVKREDINEETAKEAAYEILRHYERHFDENITVTIDAEIPDKNAEPDWSFLNKLNS